MNQTIVEKIVSNHIGHSVFSDDVVIVPVDGAMASDTTAPLAIEAFKAMGGNRVWDPSKCILVIDHAAPAPNERISTLHGLMRQFAEQQQCILYDACEGICHQLMIENRHTRPGQIFIGADSHTCTYGAIGAMGIGVGSTDLAAVWLTGKIWLRVPRTVRVMLNGPIPFGVMGKDIILAVLARTGISGATYQAIEFSGDVIPRLTLAARLTIANMAIEAGAKTAFLDDGSSRNLETGNSVIPDPDAEYENILAIDCSNLKPMVSPPHSPDLGRPVSDFDQIRVDYGFIGSCVNGRIEDLHEAARILKGKTIHSRSRLIVGPASRQIYLDAIRDGTAEILLRAGATFIPPGCGPCVGTHNGIPGNGETVISSGNRNFKGRMGNPKADIYLASPATVAASVLEGKITDPTTIV